MDTTSDMSSLEEGEAKPSSYINDTADKKVASDKIINDLKAIVGNDLSNKALENCFKNYFSRDGISFIDSNHDQINIRIENEGEGLNLIIEKHNKEGEKTYVEFFIEHVDGINISHKIKYLGEDLSKDHRKEFLLKIAEKIGEYRNHLKEISTAIGQEKSDVKLSIQEVLKNI